MTNPSFSSSTVTFNTAASSKYSKRLSKDDLDLVTKSSFPSRFQSFRPLGDQHTRLPTPDASPRSESSLSNDIPIVVRMHTPDSLHESTPGSGPLEEPQVGTAVGSTIGMALGSPSHPPVDSWQPHRISHLPPEPSSEASSQLHAHVTHSTFNNSQPQSQLPEAAPPVLSSPLQPTTPGPKKGRWKMFSVFTSKKSKSNESKKGSAQQQVGSLASVDPYVNRTVPIRSNTEKKTAKHTPLPVRSNTVSASDNEWPAVPSTSTMPPISSSQSNRHIPGTNSTSPALQFGRGGRMLDVRIPSVHMERYSVMFSNVLDPSLGSSQSQHETQVPSEPVKQLSLKQNGSSLLARRHATLDRLKTASDEAAKEINASGDDLAKSEMHENQIKIAPIKIPRRATSPVPQPTKSPAFSLFPSTPSKKPTTPFRNASDMTESPSRVRSNTTPASYSSPVKESFDLSALIQETSNNGSAVHLPMSLRTPLTVGTPLPVTTPNSASSGPLKRGKVNEFPLPKNKRTNTLASTVITSSSQVDLTKDKSTPEGSSLVLDSPSSISSVSSTGASPTMGEMRPPALSPTQKTILSPAATTHLIPNSSAKPSPVISSGRVQSTTVAMGATINPATTSLANIGVHAISLKHKPSVVASIPSESHMKPLAEGGVHSVSLKRKPSGSVSTSSESSMTSSASLSSSASASTTATLTSITSSTSMPSSTAKNIHAVTPSITSIATIDEEDTALKAAVEISIARQISISRQQRHMLRPLQSNPIGLRRVNTVAVSPSHIPQNVTLSPSTSEPKPGLVGVESVRPQGASPVYLEEHERLGEINNSTPRIIHPPSGTDAMAPKTPIDEMQKGHQYKKSENIVIEGF